MRACVRVCECVGKGVYLCGCVYASAQSSFAFTFSPSVKWTFFIAKSSIEEERIGLSKSAPARCKKKIKKIKINNPVSEASGRHFARPVFEFSRPFFAL